MARDRDRSQTELGTIGRTTLLRACGTIPSPGNSPLPLGMDIEKVKTVKLRIAIAALCAVVSIFGAFPQAAPPAAAVQEHNPEIVAALNTINLYRSWLGIPPLTIDPALQKAAEDHVEYYRLNFGDPALAGMGLHYQTPGKPGFTGASFQDRARAAGYKGSVNENAGVSGSMVWSVDWFIATVGHRLTLLDPRYTHVGMAAINDGRIKFEIIDLGAPAWKETDPVGWIAWPPHNSTGVSLSFSGEAPNPFPGATYPVGYPIHLKYFGAGDLTLTTATISKNGVPLPSFSEIGTGWLSRKTILLCTNKPLDMNTVYDVYIEGTANGERFVKTWSFKTRATNSEKLALNGQTELPPPPMELPAGVGKAHPLVQRLWHETDGPVSSLKVQRSWLWGPDTWLDSREASLESPGQTRQVYYFDKARMEVNDLQDGKPAWITAGLLVRDMIAGRIQVGINDYQQYVPSDVPLAGDSRATNPDAPTYASLNYIASIDGNRRIEAKPGRDIIEAISKDGQISWHDSLAGWAKYGSYDPTLGHNIADVFDAYLKSLPGDWRMSVGLPLAEPYWVRTNLKGEPTWVLVQVFERRVLTYTPDNRPEWRVEMGNVGRHYYTWRYGEEPPA
jgi:hypothetical protein